MTSSGKSDHPAATSKTASARILFSTRDEILTLWLERVKVEVKSAATLLIPVLVNTIPSFIEALAESLCEECSRETATESSNFAQEHGGERARVTRYNPEQIIQEYYILRDIILEKIGWHKSISERESVVIQRSFDSAIQESMTAYFLVHNRIREQFVATLTHDLRNPISAVSMSAEIIRLTTRGSLSDEAVDEIHDLATRIIKNAKRADRMIQDLLDGSLVQIGEKLALQIVDCELRAILEGAIGQRSPEEEARLVYEATDIKGFWDFDAFQRSIENLISNAFKYGREGTPVTISCDEVFGRALVKVHNWGDPIPIENMESLFQVFRRAETAKASGKRGWGIGLALARSTAERMGGSLSAESSADRGTTFVFDVPLDARPFQDAPTIE